MHSGEKGKRKRKKKKKGAESNNTNFKPTKIDTQKTVNMIDCAKL